MDRSLVLGKAILKGWPSLGFMDRSLVLGKAILKGWPSLSFMDRLLVLGKAILKGWPSLSFMDRSLVLGKAILKGWPSLSFMDRSLVLGKAILKGWPSLSPGLARGTTSHAPTLGQRQRGPTLKGLNQPTTVETASTLSGLSVSQPTQGRRCRAKPGLSDCNPVGVAADNRH